MSGDNKTRKNTSADDMAKDDDEVSTGIVTGKSPNNDALKEMDTTLSASAITTNAAMNSSEQPSASKTRPQKSTMKGAALLVLVLLTLLTIAAASVWYGWMYHWQPQQQRLQALENSLKQQLEATNRLNDRQQSAIRAAAEAEEKANALLASLRNDQALIEQRLAGHNNRLRNLSGTSRNDWMLAEAKYLLRLASQRLLMERGTTGAQALLESTNEILMAIDDMGLFIVREALAKDIMSLKLAPTIDREGLYLQLTALISAVEALPAVPPSLQQPTVPPTISPAAPPGRATDGRQWYVRWLFELKEAVLDFSQFIKIRRHDEPPQPLLSDRGQARLTHNLRLMFEQSQSALLREQATIYRQSLQQAKQWLEQYYCLLYTSPSPRDA